MKPLFSLGEGGFFLEKPRLGKRLRRCRSQKNTRVAAMQTCDTILHANTILTQNQIRVIIRNASLAVNQGKSRRSVHAPL